MASHPITSNVLSEQFDGRRPAKCESKDRRSESRTARMR